MKKLILLITLVSFFGCDNIPKNESTSFIENSNDSIINKSDSVKVEELRENSIENNSFGYFNFNIKNVNSRTIAKLDAPSLFSIYRYGDGHNLNSKVRIWITADGKVVEEDLYFGGKKYANFEAENSILIKAKEIKIWTSPAQYDVSQFIVRGQYKNYDFDNFDLINPNWILKTKENDIPKTTIINIGKWDKRINVRVNFQQIIPEGTTKKENIFCILYVDGKPFVDSHNIPYLFYEGSSIDLTTSQLSIGFHPQVGDRIKGSIKGQYFISKADLN